MKNRILTIASIAIAASLTSVATPRGTYFGQFQTRYPDSPLIEAFSCNICHTNGPGTKRTLYGDLVEAQAPSGGEVDFESLEGLDPDEDGETNLAEINTGTHPGRPPAQTMVDRLLGRTDTHNFSLNELDEIIDSGDVYLAARERFNPFDRVLGVPPADAGHRDIYRDMIRQYLETIE